MLYRISMATQTSKRRSRWKKPPILKEDGTKKRRTPTDKDEDIFRLLVPGSDVRRPWGYSLLRSNYISALLDRYHNSVLGSLDALATDGWLYLPDQPINNFRHLVYALSEKGAKHVDQPRPRHIHLYRHELMCCDIAASFELAARAHGATIFSWPAIISSDQFPRATREARNPMAIPVGNRSIRADWEPFIFKTHKSFFLPGFEADTGTEPLDSTDRTRSSIRQKFEDYLAIIHKKTHLTHFGAHSFFVPFIVMRDEQRLIDMMKLLERVIVAEKYPRQYARRFGFKLIPGFYEKPVAPTDWVAEGWKRAGYGDFSFVEREEDAA